MRARNLTPRPPSLAGKGEKAPPLAAEGLGRGLGRARPGYVLLVVLIVIVVLVLRPRGLFGGAAA